MIFSRCLISFIRTLRKVRWRLWTITDETLSFCKQVWLKNLWQFEKHSNFMESFFVLNLYFNKGCVTNNRLFFLPECCLALNGTRLAIKQLWRLPERFIPTQGHVLLLSYVWGFVRFKGSLCLTKSHRQFLYCNLSHKMIPEITNRQGNCKSVLLHTIVHRTGWL